MKGKLRDMEDRVRGPKMHWTGIPEEKQDGQRQLKKGWEFPSIEKRHHS